ncbi:MAG: GNAT family N-acetyltransferase [Streptococcaceae bacterium]|nr:GNAT family N-acetyltransferase [Streptococcaceae bacterium]
MKRRNLGNLGSAARQVLDSSNFLASGAPNSINKEMKTKRIDFSKWTKSDISLATQIWGEKEVTQYICASGVFTKDDIVDRLATEIKNDQLYGIQYWPIFERETGELIGCCGIRPFGSEEHVYEFGVHLRKKFWRKGFAAEAANAVISYSFHTLKAAKLYAGHHPENQASEKLLTQLGFKFIGENYYPPTGLYHPSYELLP